jgi:hypothetical protein
VCNFLCVCVGVHMCLCVRTPPPFTSHLIILEHAPTHLNYKYQPRPPCCSVLLPITTAIPTPTFSSLFFRLHQLSTPGHPARGVLTYQQQQQPLPHAHAHTHAPSSFEPPLPPPPPLWLDAMLDRVRVGAGQCHINVLARAFYVVASLRHVPPPGWLDALLSHLLSRLGEMQVCVCVHVDGCICVCVCVVCLLRACLVQAANECLLHSLLMCVSECLHACVCVYVCSCLCQTHMAECARKHATCNQTHLHVHTRKHTRVYIRKPRAPALRAPCVLPYIHTHAHEYTHNNEDMRMQGPNIACVTWFSTCMCTTYTRTYTQTHTALMHAHGPNIASVMLN